MSNTADATDTGTTPLLSSIVDVFNLLFSYLLPATFLVSSEYLWATKPFIRPELANHTGTRCEQGSKLRILELIIIFVSITGICLMRVFHWREGVRRVIPFNTHAHTHTLVSLRLFSLKHWHPTILYQLTICGVFRMLMAVCR